MTGTTNKVAPEATRLVPVTDVGAAIGSDQVAISLLDRRGAEIVTMWDGRLGVSEEVAAKVVQDRREEVAANDRAWAFYQAFLADRERRRNEAGEAAVAKAMPRLLARQVEEMEADATIWVGDSVSRANRSPSPQTASILAEVRLKALEAFDRKNPEQDYETWKKGA
nr:hypothetical protein [Actinomycetota bacterium]